MTTIRQSVIDAFLAFTTPLEGRVNHLYLDVLGLVTTGIGNLVDPVFAALALPWKLPDGSKAPPDVIRAQWSALKARQDLAHRSLKYAAAVTTIRLDDTDVDALVLGKLQENADFVAAHYFPMFAHYPADAQLGIMSMAWAVGPGFPLKFPTFKSAVLEGDWDGALAACTIKEAGNPGLVPRNAANRVCFANAEIVERCGLDPTVLNWPSVAQGDVHPADRAANLGTLVAVALDDARVHALEVERLEALRDMSGSSAPPPPLANS
jgi:GH24 family phage-related lysozyme (muramidase)